MCDGRPLASVAAPYVRVRASRVVGVTRRGEASVEVSHSSCTLTRHSRGHVDWFASAFGCSWVAIAWRYLLLTPATTTMALMCRGSTHGYYIHAGPRMDRRMRRRSWTKRSGDKRESEIWFTKAARARPRGSTQCAATAERGPAAPATTAARHRRASPCARVRVCTRTAAHTSNSSRMRLTQSTHCCAVLPCAATTSESPCTH